MPASHDPPSTRRNKPTRSTIVRALRDEVVRGVWAPGAPFPRRVELEKRFGVSPLLIQGVVDQLRREGFVYVKGRRGGTFVTPHPPHLYHYAVIFPDRPSADHRAWGRFFQAMSNEAAAMEREGRLRFFQFFGIDGHTDNQQMLELVEAVRDHRFAGLILAAPTSLVMQSPLVTEPGVPRVAALGGGPTLPAVKFANLVDRALDHFAARGRKRVAMIASAGARDIMIDPFIKGVSSRGLSTRVDWAQEVSLSAPQTTRRLVHLLLNPRQAERPDALFISDDNLVEFAAAGIIDAGMSVPSELEVVGHCNFPWPTPSAVPMRRLGYDMRGVMEACLASLRQQQSGVPLPQPPLPPLFEDEVPVRTTQAPRAWHSPAAKEEGGGAGE